MQKSDIIEIDGLEYFVVEEFTLNENNYALLSPLTETSKEEETLVVRIEEDEIFSIEEEEEKKSVLKHLNKLLEDGE